MVEEEEEAYAVTGHTCCEHVASCARETAGGEQDRMLRGTSGRFLLT